MNWMFSRTDGCVTIGRCRIIRLFSADDLLLLASSKSGLQQALYGFAAVCDIARMKISTSKTEVFHISKNLAHCSLHLEGVPLKQWRSSSILWSHSQVIEGRQDKELKVRSGKTSAMMRALHHSIVLKQELSRNV